MAVSKDETKRPRSEPFGRPTLYKPEYCQMLIDHCSEGLSFEAFAGLIGVAGSTLYEWAKANPDFSEAKSQAMQKCRLWWEKAGTQGMFMGGKDNPFNATIWVYNMKCRFRNEWTERKEIELKAEVSESTPEERQKRLSKLKKMMAEEV